jgi:hypothetical protein
LSEGFIVGVDPGSTKGHGVSLYENGKLIGLKMMRLMVLHDFLLRLLEEDKVTLHIEDVNAKKAVWHGKSQSKAAYGKTSQNVALCKWAQVEVERMCEYIGVDFERHPVSSKWKSQASKVEFERVTGWEGRSNEDTRSAAWFGYIGVTR